MLVFCERSIDQYQIGQTRKGSTDLIGQVDPGTFEMHNLSDPVAIMGWYNDAEALSGADQDGLQIGEDGGPIIHIGGDQVNLYAKSAADFVALAQKTFNEIKKITDYVAFIDPLLRGVPVVVEPGNGAPSAFQAALAVALAAAITPTPSSVAADKVKAT